MKLTEMLGQYEELLDKKDQLAKDTKDNNAAIDKLKAEIAEMMIDEDIRPRDTETTSTASRIRSNTPSVEKPTCRNVAWTSSRYSENRASASSSKKPSMQDPCRVR